MVAAKLLSEMISAGLGGHAGSAAAALIERPGGDLLAGPDTFDLWKQHFEERLSELAAALAFEQPKLFATGCGWALDAYRARGLEGHNLERALGILDAVLGERLPEGAAEVLKPYFSSARSVLERDPGPATELAVGDQRALLFLSHTLEGNSRLAASYLLELLQQGASVTDLFEQVVVRAQREVGELWHRGEINVAEEHLATLTVQKAVAVLAHGAPVEPANGKIVVVSSVTGDTHDLGLRLLSELFALAGWRSVPLGADVPRLDLLQALDAFEPDLLVLSATLSRHLVTIRSTVELIRSHSRWSEIRILVGGRAFGQSPELWRASGADGWASSLGEAVAEADRMVSSRSS